jgi:hypothetical protein
LPTPAEACERLRQPQNEPLQWLLGEILVARAQQEHWHHCRVLQQLAEGSELGERAWNGLIERSRQALTNPLEAQTRARTALTPVAADFDEKLDDLVAEMVAVVYLSTQGFSQLRFCLPGELATPDLRAVKCGQDAFIEVKNLREPLSLAIIAFSRWHANRAADPDRFSFEAIVEYEGIEPELNPQQREALERLVDRLPDRQRPVRFTETLPGGLEITLSLRDGHGVMMTHGPGGALDPVRIRSSQSLVYKIMAPAAKALLQLYNPRVPAGALRVMLLRWKVPDDVWLVGEEVREQVGTAIQGFLGAFFPDLEVHLISSLQQL